MTTIFGLCEPAFEPVRQALAKLVSTGADVGASAAVVHEGKLVADVWGGHHDEQRTVPWERDSITCVWSTTKTMCNLSALILADAGELNIDDRPPPRRALGPWTEPARTQPVDMVTRAT